MGSKGGHSIMTGIFFLMVSGLLSGACYGSADDLLLYFSTKNDEPDRYADGTIVLDRECYALVWYGDGKFDGFYGNGKPIDEKDEIVLVAPLAENGHCADVLFQIDKNVADRLSEGRYSLVLLDTRVSDGGITSPRGVSGGKVEVLNGYSVVVQDVVPNKALFTEMTQCGTNTIAKYGIDIDKEIQHPRINGIDVSDRYVMLKVENLSGYIRIYGKTKENTFLPIGGAVKGEGRKEDVFLVIPKTGKTGLFRAIRSL